MISEQIQICKKFGSEFIESSALMKIGISKNIEDNFWPIHGLRHEINGDTTGWYIWRGEYSADPDFFMPIHTSHITEVCPRVIKYLGLAPGWRFLILESYEDVWQDKSLII
jgi:hypothetical protein